MPEKLRFRQVSSIKLEEMEEVTAHDVRARSTKEQTEVVTLEYPVYDMLLMTVSFSPKPFTLNTEVKEVTPRQTLITLADLFVSEKTSIEEVKTSTTEISEVYIFHEVPIVTDIHLAKSKIHEFPTTISTEVSVKVQKEVAEDIEASQSFDIGLEDEIVPEQIIKRLNTEVVVTEVGTGIENLRSVEELQLPILEEFIEADGRFPRSFSECLNSPFVLLIGEDDREWHIPIIYVLRELFREITDRHPRVTFREPEVLEEGVEEHVDSLDLHSLEQFMFEHKIEFLDARRMRLAVDEFARTVRGRLKSAFLQQFGVLAIAVRRKDLEKARKTLKVEGIRVYTCKPDDSKYELFCSKVLGVSSLSEFFSNLKTFEKCLQQTVRRFSIFVKRGGEATDRLQYPFKVATFVYLLNELRKRKKKLLNNFEELCEFVKEVMNKNIKIEEETTVGNRKVIPDLIYSPGEEKEFFIEIETLIGTLEPMKKIDETIEKYKDSSGANIWIVLRPVSALLHYEELKARKRAYEALYKDKNIKVEFKVLTLLVSKGKFRWELVSLDSFLRGIRHAE